MHDFTKFAVLTKVDVAKREVSGIATQEVLDHSGEIMDYAGSVPYFKAWSKQVAQDTKGKSLGNIREQHSNIAAGKMTAMEFMDAEKAIAITVKVVDDQSWAKVEEGVLTGFSIGGKYVKLWKDDSSDNMRFIAEPVEISLVDRPCCPSAIFDSIKSQQFEVVKADGTREMRKFDSTHTEEMMTKEEIEARIAKETAERVTAELAKAEEKRKADAEAAKAEAAKRMDEAKADFHARIDKAAEAKGMKKGLYEVREMAAVLQTLYYLFCEAKYEAEYEGDESEVPAKLEAALNQLAETFLAMATEETNELTAAAAAKGAGTMSDLLKSALKNSFTKRKSFHERKAARHQAIAKAHNDAAVELEKSETPEIKALATMYKTIAGEHEALVKSELSEAEHAALMIEATGDDDAKAETAAKAVEASLAKSADEPSPEAIAELKKSAQSFDAGEMIKKAQADMLTNAVEEYKNSPEGKAMVAKAAQEALAKQLNVTLEPTAVRTILQPRAGQQTSEVTKSVEPTATAGL